MNPEFSRKTAQMLGFLMIAFSVIGRYILSVTSLPSPIGETAMEVIGNISSFLTIWTNILAGLYFFILVFFEKSKAAVFIRKPIIEKGILVYILFIGIAFHLLLSATYHPVGMAKVFNIFLHYLNPVYFLVYALYYTKPGGMKHSQSLYWIIYPLVFGVYTFIRGEITDFYPYPFINADILGYFSAIKNMLGVTTGFFLFGNILIFMDNLLSGRKEKKRNGTS